MVNLRRPFLRLKKHFWNAILTRKNRNAKKPGVSNVSDVIVSLTSFPARIDIVYLTIETILNQRFKPRKVVLWLSKDQIQEDELPDTLKRQQQRGLDIRFVEGDIKAYKKLFYTIQEFPNDFIVTADDDVYYPKWWLEKLVEKRNKFPNTIICYRSHLMAKASEHVLKSYSDWKKVTFGTPGFNVFPVGVSGVMYHASFFDEEFLKQDIFMKICPNNDDIWFKSMTLKTGIKCVQVYDKVRIFQTIEGSQEESLYQVNVLEKNNDVQLKAVFDRYDLYEKID